MIDILFSKKVKNKNKKKLKRLLMGLLYFLV